MLLEGEPLALVLADPPQPRPAFDEQLLWGLVRVVQAQASAMTRSPFSVASSTSERCNRLTSSRVSIPAVVSSSESASRLGATGNIECVTVPKVAAMIGGRTRWA